MLKLPDFMRIDPNDFNAENIRRMSSYGKPQEDFLTGAVQQFQNSALFKERKVAREYFENETEIDNKIRFYFNREGLQIIDNTVSNVKLRHSFYRKLVNQKVNYLLSKAFTIKCKNEEFEQILQGYFNKKFLRRLQNMVRQAVVSGINWFQVYYDEDGNLVALDTVFNTYNSLDNRTKAKYASSFSGNPNFRQQVYNLNSFFIF